jgi:TetR/AcrR family transcriptional repressor of nem operon
MKKSKAETAETRRRIVEVATQAFKCSGIQGTGVAEIMAAAGLSHGGFYRHFASKEQLVAEACAVGMDMLIESVGTAGPGGRESLLKHIEYSLSAEYRDDTLGGCPLVAMGSELVRTDAATRRVASQGFEGLVDVIAKWMPAESPATARDDAIFTLVAMMGAVTMSRIVDDPDTSDRILRVTKKRLAALPAKAQGTEKKQRPAGAPAKTKTARKRSTANVA